MHPIGPYARTAFAQGWAASGGPMTDRVKAACIAAVEHAAEHAEDPDILEVTLHLGHLEGVWARIFDRRDALHARGRTVMLAAWRAAVARLDAAAMVRRLRAKMGLSESDDSDEPDPEQLRALATAAAADLLAWLPGTTAWQELRQTLQGLLAAGRAEGAADAIALAADSAGHVGIDFDLAFNTAYTALGNLGQIWADADGWLAKALARQTDQLGRVLAGLASAGASYEDMLTAADGILDGVDGDAVAFITDWALATALGQGALDLYASEGVQAVWWLSAGDVKVCPICEANEAGSPYSVADFPFLPAHPLCRCAPAGDMELPAAYAAVLAA